MFLVDSKKELHSTAFGLLQTVVLGSPLSLSLWNVVYVRKGSVHSSIGERAIIKARSTQSTRQSLAAQSGLFFFLQVFSLVSTVRSARRQVVGSLLLFYPIL